MANTYTLIASSTVGSGGAANIDFTSIPGTYTDLLIKTSIRTNAADVTDTIGITFNNNTSNYSFMRIRGNGTNATSSSASSQSNVATGYAVGNNATASTFSNLEFYVPNYAGSNYKSFSSDGVSENNATEAYTGLWAGLWANVSAITSVKLIPITGSLFQQYSTAYLYGISNS
jgi:hypothetical protein